MDTTYVTIMLVVFLVMAGLAIDVGYLYVSEEDLQSAAQSAALTGAQAIKQRLLVQMRSDPRRLGEVANDLVQSEARKAAMESVSGKQRDTALVELANANGNALTGDNDITVGFWNMSSRSYTPGGRPVNAVQVRTRRTAESSSVGMGNLGSFLARITGTESFGLTPVAVAAIGTGTRANVAFCSEVCEPACSFPEVCSIKERRMSRAPWDGSGPPPRDRYLYTSLLHPVGITNSMSDLVCQEMPQQEVCGRPIYTAAGTSDSVLRDLRSMMYDPKVDRSNKEYDGSGKVLGWWVVVPVSDCSSIKSGDLYEPRVATGYSLVRISRICAQAGGCGGSVAATDVPAVTCSSGESGLYIDRISCVGCGSKERQLFPGLHPVLVD